MQDSMKAFVVGSEYSSFNVEEDILLPCGIALFNAGAAKGSDLTRVVAGADALLVGLTQIEEPTVRMMSKCKVLVEYGVGYDNIDVQAAAAQGIAVANVPDYGTEDVATHTIALLLTLARKICRSNQSVRTGCWSYSDFVPIFRLSGKTIGIVGYGRIGQAVAKKAKAFGLEVMVHDPYLSDSVLGELGVQQIELGALFSKSDFVSLHLPASKENVHLVDARLLGAMKSTAFLINTARGSLVDEAALVEALRKETIGGAALDVLAHEPPGQEHPLLRMPNVVITPHIAWYSEEANLDLRSKAAKEVARVLTGHPPLNWVNRTMGDFWRFSRETSRGSERLAGSQDSR